MLSYLAKCSHTFSFLCIVVRNSDSASPDSTAYHFLGTQGQEACLFHEESAPTQSPIRLDLCSLLHVSQKLLVDGTPPTRIYQVSEY